MQLPSSGIIKISTRSTWAHNYHEYEASCEDQAQSKKVIVPQVGVTPSRTESPGKNAPDLNGNFRSREIHSASQLKISKSNEIR